MSGTAARAFLLAALLAAVAPRAAGGADDRAGTAGGLFLRLANSPRAAAMADVVAATDEGVFASWGNPAGTIRSAAREVGLARTQSFADIALNMVGYSQPMSDRDVLVVSYFGVEYGTIEGRDATGRATGAVKTGDDAIGLTWGRRIGERLSAGITGRYVHSRLGRHTADAFTFDVGFVWRTPIEGLSLGVVGQNLVGDLTFVRDASPLPRTVRIGASQAMFDERLLVGVDLVKGIDTDWEAAVGVEARLARFLYLRAGATSARDEGLPVTAGVGLRVRRFALDYAFQPFGDLGNQHRAGLRAEF